MAVCWRFEAPPAVVVAFHAAGLAWRPYGLSWGLLRLRLQRVTLQRLMRPDQQARKLYRV